MKRFNLQQIEQMRIDLQTMTYRELAEKHNCSIQLIQYYCGKKPEPVKVKCMEPGCNNMITVNHKSRLCNKCYSRYYAEAQKAMRGTK